MIILIKWNIICFNNKMIIGVKEKAMSINYYSII